MLSKKGADNAPNHGSGNDDTHTYCNNDEYNLNEEAKLSTTHRTIETIKERVFTRKQWLVEALTDLEDRIGKNAKK